MFSDLVVLEGVTRLLSLYPGKSFSVCFGPESSFNIESTDGEIAAECFAVTTAASNRKLEKDSTKLVTQAAGRKMYLYFYSQNDSDEKLQRIYQKYPQIEFIKINGFHL